MKKDLFLLHILLALYSLGGVCSKLAGRYPVFSFQFFLYYGFLLLLLAVYALGWQQIIKRLPLTTAFANKAVTIAWGLVWGLLVFKEQITAGKLIGSLIVISGVILFVTADRTGESHE